VCLPSPVHPISPVLPVLAPRTHHAECVIVPAPSVPGLRTRSPVRLKIKKNPCMRRCVQTFDWYCTNLPQLHCTPAHRLGTGIAKLSLLLCIYDVYFLSLHCWEGLVSKHFTVSLHLVFTKYVTNKNGLDLRYNAVSTYYLSAIQLPCSPSTLWNYEMCLRPVCACMEILLYFFTNLCF
jgi:hypothetical protein